MNNTHVPVCQIMLSEKFWLFLRSGEYRECYSGIYKYVSEEVELSVAYRNDQVVPLL